MPVNLASLRKLETVPASELANGRSDKDRVVVLVRLHKGASRPEYVAARAEISPEIFSAEMPAGDLRRLEHDPAVASVSLSRDIPLIKQVPSSAD